jgi:mannose/fructose/N-acetylgalactosamine-specific phosphotransferase system component IIB
MTSRYCPLLARIDDRLIHGQVVVGCCEPLGARRILLVDESVASDALQQKIYRAGVPPDVRVDFVSVGGAPELMHQIEVEDGLDCVVVVVARAAVMEDLRTTGVEFASVQLGGAHARAGATHEVVPGFFLCARFCMPVWRS